MNAKMNAREYFEQAFMVDSLILAKRKLLQKYRGREQKLTASYSPMSGFGGGGTRRPMADAVDGKLDTIAKLEREIEQLRKLPEEMYEVIQKLENPRYRFILENYYLLRERIDEIAENLNVSGQTVYRLLSKALQAVEPFIPNQGMV